MEEEEVCYLIFREISFTFHLLASFVLLDQSFEIPSHRSILKLNYDSHAASLKKKSDFD